MMQPYKHSLHKKKKEKPYINIDIRHCMPESCLCSTAVKDMDSFEPQHFSR